MEVILPKDVEKVGLRGDVVNVARGYARNFLLPRRLAEVATPARVTELRKIDERRARHEAKTFEEAQQLVERLAQVEDPLEHAEEVIAELGEHEKLEALNAHPAIGARELSPRSAAEQGTDADPAILAELAYQNQVYEEKFGFRFVVFVNRRPKSEILDVLRERLARSREEELDTAVRELVAIARDRWTRT